MRLVIFPGGGSPDSGQYQKVYKLLEEKALLYGFDSVDLLRGAPHEVTADSDEHVVQEYCKAVLA